MKNWGLYLCIAIYTIVFFWLGMRSQMKYDQLQLKGWEEQAWTQGCHICAQFAKDDCSRDQLQGVEKEHKIGQ